MLVRFLILLILCILIGLGGCVPPKSQPPDDLPPPSTPQYHVHTTRCLAESLSHIAKWYTGDSQNEEDLASLNQIQSPDCIGPGIEILIPTELIKTQECAPCPEPYRHTVHCLGESLSIIAKWYTDDYRSLECLAKINPHIEDPNLIRLNDVIDIPAHIMQTWDPLPPEYVEESNRVIAPESNYTHKVIWEGESLVYIAKWYTGDAQNGQRLVDLNPDLPNPNCIKQGTEILIPIACPGCPYGKESTRT